MSELDWADGSFQRMDSRLAMSDQLRFMLIGAAESTARLAVDTVLTEEALDELLRIWERQDQLPCTRYFNRGWFGFDPRGKP